METFTPEDILVDNLSFKLNKGSSYVVSKRSVRFYPFGTNVYTPQSGSRVINISLNGEDNTWLDPQSVRIFFNVQNRNTTLNRKLRPLSPAHFFRRIRIVAGSHVVEDFDSYNRVHHMFSKMMSQGARKDEANESFGYRYDDEVKSFNNQVGTRLDYDVNSTTCPGFKGEMIVGFKPLVGLFSQFKLLPLKYMGNLTIELELVNSANDCLINPDDDYDETDNAIAENFRNTFTKNVVLPGGNASQFELSSVFVPVMFQHYQTISITNS